MQKTVRLLKLLILVKIAEKAFRLGNISQKLNEIGPSEKADLEFYSSV